MKISRTVSRVLKEDMDTNECDSASEQDSTSEQELSLDEEILSVLAASETDSDDKAKKIRSKEVSETAALQVYGYFFFLHDGFCY